MKLLDCTFAYKIPQYNVRVTTFAPRKSLAFEWLILEASLTANAHSEYADMSFEDLFAKVFKLSESETFLRMSLSNLIEYKAVECARFSDEISFSVLKMSDVRITETGIEMHQKGMLPSKSSENLFQVFKNSVDKDFFLMETNRIVYRGEPANSEILCDEKGKIEMPTVPQIKDFLLEKQKGKQKKNPFDWLKKETELGEIKISEDDDVRYEKVRNALLIDTALQCSFEKPELCRGNEMEALFASLPDIPKEFSHLPEFEFESIDESVNKMFMVEKFLENMKNCVLYSLESGESFVVDFTKQNQNLIKENTRSLIEKKSKPREMVVIFQNAPKFNYIAASKSSPVHKIEVPYAVTSEDILFDSKKKRFRAGQITIKAEGFSKEIPVGFIEENEDFSIEQIAEQIIAQYSDENKDLQKLDKFLRGEKSEDKQKKSKAKSQNLGCKNAK